MISILFLYLMAIIFSLKVIYQNRKKMNCFLFFNVAFSLYYFIIPFFNIYLLFFKVENIGSFTMKIAAFDLKSLFITYLFTFFLYLVFLIVYKIFKKSSEEVQFQKDSIENIFGRNTDEVYNKMIIWGMITLVLGVFSELVIIYSFGGIFNAISSAEKLRAYGVDRSIYMKQSLLFVNVLATISLVSPFVFLFAKRVKNTLFSKFCLLTSFAASIFYLLFFAGRMPIILFVSCFLIDYFFRKFKHPWIALTLSVVFLLLFLSKMDDLFFYLSYGNIKISEVNKFSSIINDFSFPYSNILFRNQINSSFDFRYGIDYFTWIINIIPSSFLNLFGLAKIDASFSFITKFYDPNGITLGGVPTDMLTFGFRQLSYLGSLIHVILMVFLCLFLDKIIASLNQKNAMFFSIRIAFMMFVLVPYADLDSFFRNRFDMVIVIIIGYSLMRVKNKAKNNLV
ncbi:O-antigen polymerase [Carnobacterium maltaromaticum]|uniref:O-antigen polymerase n=1 Tax=Carnobacterium maltaromaticum TaxID=2751 RepID=UPI0039AEC53C